MNLLPCALHLKKGREKSVLNRHPWLFSGAIQRAEGVPTPGDLVTVWSHDGRFLAHAYINPLSQIRARLLSWREDETIDTSFWQRKLSQAIAARKHLLANDDTSAYRLVHAEADGLPGFVVDRYGDFLVIQCLSAGIEQRKDLLVNLLVEQIRPRGIVERSDVQVRKLEGLRLHKGVCWGEPPPTELEVRENGLCFQVDLMGGQKTGFYLDQRDNRQAVCRPRFMADRDVLNVFAYTGAFGAYAAAAGARAVTQIDSSVVALELAEANMQGNGFVGEQFEYLAGDAFEILRHYRDSGSREFDVIILDPPRFARTRQDVRRASRGYKDLNWLALRLLRPGGLLATFSCSSHVDASLFQKIVFSASVDAGRQVQIIRPLSQAADHPILLTFPESAYLKGLLCRVVS